MIVYGYYKGSHIVVFCFDLTNGASFNSIEAWNSNFDKNNNTSVKLLVGTKAELKRVIPTTEGYRLAAKINAQYIEISCKSDINTNEFVSEVNKLARLYLLKEKLI